MPVFPCHKKAICPSPSNPFDGFSAEQADGETFIGYSTGFGPTPPPLGSDFTAVNCVTFCESQVSQSDADLCAARNNVQCLSTIFPGSVVFQNNPQQGVAYCPDGLPFYYTVVAGTFSALSQAEADAIAASYADELASEFMVCLSSLAVTTINILVPYTAVITASGQFLVDGHNQWALVAGQVPPGLTLNFFGNTGHLVVLSGTPTLFGTFTFVLCVTDPLGDQMCKAYTIIVTGNVLADAQGGPVLDTGGEYTIMP